METTSNSSKPIISTESCPSIYNIRKCGNTKRQVEFAIEYIFNNHIVKVVDHTNLKKLSEMLFDRIIQKLLTTYGIHLCELEINRKELTISLKRNK